MIVNALPPSTWRQTPFAVAVERCMSAWAMIWT